MKFSFSDQKIKRDYTYFLVPIVFSRHIQNKPNVFSRDLKTV